MKFIYPLLLTFLVSTTSQSQEPFTKIHMDFGKITSMISSGTLFSKKDVRETYYVWGIGGLFDTLNKSVHLSWGYLVFDLKRNYNAFIDGAAYDLLDSCKLAESYLHQSQSKFWEKISTAEEKEEAQKYISLYPELMNRFNEHVVLYVETSALKTAVSHRAYLDYQ